MEREACRAAMLPIFLCVSLSMQCFLGSLCLFRSWKLLGSSAGLQEYSALLARREPIGDVWGVRVDSADPVVRRVWTFTYYRARRRDMEADTGEGLKGTLHLSKLVRVYVCTVLFDDLAKAHKTRHRAISACARRRSSHDCCYSHKPAIPGAIDSIHWLHDCRHSSLVVAACTGEALQECTGCNTPLRA